MTIINSDLTKRVVIQTDQLPWHQSTTPGIDRKMLERSGNDGSDRATSIVRYQAGKSYSPHCHPAGEEIFVLEGTFSDEQGDFPAGSYIRNPPGSFHQPYSEYGCVIFVKLQQMERIENKFLHIDSYREQWRAAVFAGIDFIKLYSDSNETVELIRYQANSSLVFAHNQKAQEIFVLQGQLQDETQLYPQGSWIRNPANTRHDLFSKTGCTIYQKTSQFSG